MSSDGLFYLAGFKTFGADILFQLFALIENVELLQIGQPAPFGLNVRMGDPVAR